MDKSMGSPVLCISYSVIPLHNVYLADRQNTAIINFIDMCKLDFSSKNPYIKEIYQDDYSWIRS